MVPVSVISPCVKNTSKGFNIINSSMYIQSVTHIMEGIGSRVDALGNQSFNAKGHVMLILGRKSLAI